MARGLQIDTLAFAKKLRAAGADERLADAIVEGITAADTFQLATKADLRDVERNVEHDFKADVAKVRSEMFSEIADVKGELKDLEISLATTRLIGIVAVGIVLIATMDAIF